MMITNLSSEKLENNMVKLEIEVDNDFFEEGMSKSYKKNVKRISVPGFRRGKAPRSIIEKMYGAAVFYDDCLEYVAPKCYEEAVKQQELDVVGEPEMDIVKLEAGSPFIFSAKVYVKPEFELGNYRDIRVERVVHVVEEKNIDDEVDKARNRNASLESKDTTVEKGDILNIDFVGYTDEGPFEGGDAKGHELEIGSGNFIPGFEDALLGKKIGESHVIDVTFPEDYHAENLAGKSAKFDVIINSAKYKLLPDLDDEFAKDVSEFETLAEYRNDIRTKLQKENDTKGRSDTADSIIEKIGETTTIDIPPPMIDKRTSELVDEFSYHLSYMGMDIDSYLSIMKITPENFVASQREHAAKQVKARLILEKIAELENIAATDEEVESEITASIERFKMTRETFLERLKNDLSSLEHDVKIRKTIDLLIDTCAN